MAWRVTGVNTACGGVLFAFIAFGSSVFG